MDNPTIEQLTSKMEEMAGTIEKLWAALDYAIYGIGNPHPDPREGKSES